MSRKRAGDDEPRDGFGALVGPVRPLAGRSALRPPPAGGAQPTARGPGPEPTPEPARILREEPGSGRAADEPKATLRALRTGEHEPERTLDLHGFGTRAARTAVLRELASARDAGARCVLVIHGRGLHSGSGPLLRDALPDWLAGEPCAAWLRAFAVAPRSHGGPGATLVLLRRARGPAVSSGRRSRKPR